MGTDNHYLYQPWKGIWVPLHLCHRNPPGAPGVRFCVCLYQTWSRRTGSWMYTIWTGTVYSVACAVCQMWACQTCRYCGHRQMLMINSSTQNDSYCDKMRIVFPTRDSLYAFALQTLHDCVSGCLWTWCTILIWSPWCKSRSISRLCAWHSSLLRPSAKISPNSRLLSVDTFLRNLESVVIWIMWDIACWVW